VVLLLRVSPRVVPATPGETVPETIYDVSLELKSRREIPSTAFDQGKPMRILINPPSRVYAGLQRYTSLEGEPISADSARQLPVLLSEVEIRPQTINPGQTLAFVVGSRDPVSISVADAPSGVAIRRGLNRQHQQILENVRFLAAVVIGVVAFVMGVTWFFFG